jgi:predicted nucleic acid-binding protein
VIAVDSGFFYALLDRSDRWHARAVQWVHSQGEGWITTWPVLAETTDLLLARGVGRHAATLMQEVADGSIDVWGPPPESLSRLPVLMRKYAGLPMDLADATLVVLAEHGGHGRILTTDERDFQTYRWKQRKSFENLLAG